MSLLQTLLTSPRRTLRQSGSTQNWQDRVADLVFILGVFAAAALCYVLGLSWWQALFVCVLCLLPSLPLRWMGWLKLFGPVLYYDMVRQARRSRFAVLRFTYLLFLVFMLANVTMSIASFRGSQTDVHQGAGIAQKYFDLFMVAQLVAVVLLTPAYVGGAIAEEKDRKTLEYLLATDLRNREIVLSKLGSRLANMSLLVMTGLPILSVLQFLGGVDPNMVFASFAVTATTMVSLASVSILCSALCKKPRDAIALTYLILLLYYVASQTLAIPGAWGRTPPLVFAAIETYNRGNVISLILAVNEAGAHGTLAKELPVLTLGYVRFHAFVALPCLALAIIRLRRVALAQFHGKAAKAPRPWRVGKRPPLGDLPMLWKEINCEGHIRSRLIGIVLVNLVFALSFAPAGSIIIDSLNNFYAPINQFNNIAIRMIAWLRVANPAVGCLLMVAIAIRASTTLTREREKQTLDMLLTTPLSSTALIGAKWAGSILGLRVGLLWPVLIWAAGIVTGGLHILALPLVMFSWLVYAAFAASLGMWFSSVCRSSLRATLFTFMALIGLWGGHWMIWLFCTAPGTHELGAEVKKVQAAALTPPFVMYYLPFSTEDFEAPRSVVEWQGVRIGSMCAVGLGFWALAATVLYSSINLRPRRPRKKTGKAPKLDPALAKVITDSGSLSWHD